MSGVKTFVKNYVMEVILLIICVIIAVTTKGFLKPANLLNILSNTSMKGVIAFGMTLVIIAGEIDLSISSTVAGAGIITSLVGGALARANLLPLEIGVIVGMLAALAFGVVVGFLNGWIRTRFNIPTFIITLAMMNLLYGVDAILTKGFPIMDFPVWYSKIGAGRLLGIPVPAIILLIVCVLTHVLMSYTRFGRAVYAVGGNAESARLSGIDVTKTTVAVMIIVQVLAVLGGIMTSSQSMSAAHNFGRGWEMDVIASVIIGGTSMTGGIGKVRGTLVGIIFLGVIMNAMTLNNINEYLQYVMRGGLILIAVLINALQHKKTLEV